MRTTADECRDARRGRSSTVGRVAAALLAAAAVVAAAGGPADAQEQASETDSAAAEAAADTASAEGTVPVYRREVFDYPGGGRRNPFVSVDAGVEEGPQFDNLRLTGVIYSPSVGSVAVLMDQSTGERYRVRNGQTIGQARVLEIGRTEVRFAVSGAAGQTRRETLQVEERERESEG